MIIISHFWKSSKHTPKNITVWINDYIKMFTFSRLYCLIWRLLSTQILVMGTETTPAPLCDAGNILLFAVINPGNTTHLPLHQIHVLSYLSFHIHPLLSYNGETGAFVSSWLPEFVFVPIPKYYDNILRPWKDLINMSPRLHLLFFFVQEPLSNIHERVSNFWIHFAFK